ncbi:MAG: DUF885 domain-containing protein [Gammaproteobacteria bacterium]|nr:DUF885 domain-containing protein [Gammaproteobacteria bacterium]
MNLRYPTSAVRILLAVITVSLLGACATPRSSAPEAPGAADPSTVATAQLHALFDEAWDIVMQNNPTWASGLGDLRFNDRWPDRSLAAFAARHEEARRILASLRDIDRAALSPAEQLNYDLFESDYVQEVSNYQYRHFLIPLNQRGGIQSADQLATRIRFDSEQHYRDWITRLATFDVYMDQTIALMRQGISEGLVHPRIIMERLPAQIAAQLVYDPTASPFYSPFKNKPDSITQAVFDDLARDAQQAITTSVLPAYQRMADFFATEYLPACRESVGVWDTPRGREYYEKRTMDYTTTTLSPDAVHEIGLSEVARIRGEMKKVMDGLGYTGTFAEFLEFLRTDPQFYHTSADALLQDYLATSKRIDPELVKLFSDLPRMPYGVKPIPDAIAPDTTTAYYSGPAADGSRAGYYFVNLYRPEVRPRYEIEVLTVHEAMPGHHLQIALAQELGDLPRFRRFGGYTAFVEGWGLYSESLGEELGLYKDPYSKFGQLTYEMWRAVRLVVDTGIHYKGWSRQQAIDFFTANAAKSEYDIINEIDRYIAWPGQALAYKIGELKIKELRQRGEQTLGSKFDIRAFHKVVLGSGAVPLSILERNVDAWIASQ